MVQTALCVNTTVALLLGRVPKWCKFMSDVHTGKYMYSAYTGP